MSIIEEWYHQLVNLIQMYGWYVVFALFLAYLVKEPAQNALQNLISYIQKDDERKRILDAQAKKARQRKL